MTQATGAALPKKGVAKKHKSKSGAEVVEIPDQPGKSREQLLAELTISTVSRNAFTARGFASGHCGHNAEYKHAVTILAELCGKVRTGNLDDLTDMLAAQAMTLDTMFTEYSRRAMSNMGQYLDAAHQYSNMATKAQAQCRTTIETIARVKREGKQTVNVVHVHQGAQAVVADTINQGGAGGKTDGQSHAKAGDAPIAALPCPDPARDGVPLPRHEERALSYARRHEPGGP